MAKTQLIHRLVAFMDEAIINHEADAIPLHPKIYQEAKKLYKKLLIIQKNSQSSEAGLPIVSKQFSRKNGYITGKQLIEQHKWRLKEHIHEFESDMHCVEIFHPTNKQIWYHLCDTTPVQFNSLAFRYDKKNDWQLVTPQLMIL